jgi:hydroxypyruvate reductase
MARIGTLNNEHDMATVITDPKIFLISLFKAAVAAADPMAVIPTFLPPRPNGRLIVIGAGKASARMAEAVEQTYGPCEGLVITRYGYERVCQGIEIVQAAHPVPDAAGEKATKRLLNLVSDLTKDDHVLALISGGGSALLCAPIDGLTLADKMDVNQGLLASGAPISEMNVIRKRLSRVKGGKLAAACYPAQLTSLVISDVPGDDLSLIASGPTVADPSTSAQALEILDRYNIPVSAKVRHAIEASVTAVASDDPCFSKTKNIIIAAPSQSLLTAKKIAIDRGCIVHILGDALEGEARYLARKHAQHAQSIQATMSVSDRPILLLSGGECTVTKRGDGIGGPNAEYTLAAAIELAGAAGIHVISCDTDGVDGAAEIAGAYAGPESLNRAEKQGVFPGNALSSNDSHAFFRNLNDQIITGPTLTNVNDFRAILIYPDEQSPT